MRIYMDYGDSEVVYGQTQELLDGMENVRKLLVEEGFGKDELKCKVIPGAVHSEKDWSKRFPEVFLWLYSKGL